MNEPRTMYAWFDRSAETFGDSPALEVGGMRLTYRQLRERARRLAARLIAANDGRAPRRVGLLASRSLGTYAGYLGILWTGAAVVPLSPDHPNARVRDIAKAAELDLVVTDPGGAGTDPGVPVVSAEDVDSAAAPPYREPDPEDVAYIIFTSGSTGAAKGVPISHRNISSYLEQIAARYEIGPGSRVSGNFELTFDGSVHDLFVTWSRGGTLVVPSRSQLLSPVMAVNNLELTHWFSVPSLISFAAKLETLTPGCMPTLRWSLFGGEAVPLAAARQWRQAAPNSRLEVLYGPTELTIASTAFRLPADPVDWPVTSNGIAPIGSRLPRLELRVVDESGATADTGELCVRGPQRFGGYLDPGDDAGAFLPGGGGEADWYRTGDRVAQQDGYLVYLGRSDHQVKIHGHRIEPGEIEAELRRLPGVRDATVLAVPSSGGDPELTAAVCGSDCVPEELYNTLRDRLPAYMLPRRIAALDQLPLNTNGKIDRRALLDQLGYAT
ncbi:amino acid adenylation domain-containing protein [Stackebrandtia nassauensis]|uniref:Amino acid adenylation domain protein n=1 Tax=Stackebrandtia nassauensis (strain DSM 44728 / CIP 108903 / NRRL B-16338 / NBRC 102104 / LLR-40K-21) TaxID=446470 RepID=D3QB44_STANL|nr:amino acid adenylation domain-containing protein [Stackebrandtia nassauensis]ADD40861.1 amino acid adenylation domain protein [Stackebrandtia nassauensis DSM 44728]